MFSHQSPQNGRWPGMTLIRPPQWWLYHQKRGCWRAPGQSFVSLLWNKAPKVILWPIHSQRVTADSSCRRQCINSTRLTHPAASGSSLERSPGRSRVKLLDLKQWHEGAQSPGDTGTCSTGNKHVHSRTVYFLSTCYLPGAVWAVNRVSCHCHCLPGSPSSGRAVCTHAVSELRWRFTKYFP